MTKQREPWYEQPEKFNRWYWKEVSKKQSITTNRPENWAEEKEKSDRLTEKQLAELPF